MSLRRASCLIAPFLLFSLRALPCFALWFHDGNAITTTPTEQTEVTTVSDGAGGAIIVWEDGTSTHDIYAQRIFSDGHVAWTTNGIAICNDATDQKWPVAVSDETGGAIIVWVDYRNGPRHLYGQRVDGNGTSLWNANGNVISLAADVTGRLRIVEDGAGGGVFAWVDYRNGNEDIYAQRVNSSGSAWNADVAVCKAVYNQRNQSMVPDGSGGAIIAWEDYRTNSSSVFGQLYVQRVNGSGATQWSLDGTSTHGFDIADPQLVSDGANGAIILFTVQNGALLQQSFLQRINSSGTLLWGDAPLTTGLAADFHHPMISDGAGGVIVPFGMGIPGLRVQRIDGSGNWMWPDDGVFACDTDSSIGYVASVPDGAHGVILAWADERNSGDPDIYHPDIYSQRIDLSGNPLWAANGAPLCLARLRQYNVSGVGAGDGTAIFTWRDYRANQYAFGYADIYSEKASGSLTGVSDTPSASFTVSGNRPNPFQTATSFDVNLERASRVRVEIFDVAGHRVRSIDAGQVAAGASRVLFDGRDDYAHALPSGVYFYKVNAGAETVTKKMVITR